MRVTVGGAVMTGAALVLEALAGRAPIGAGLLTRLAAVCTLAGGAALRFSVIHAGHPSANDRDETLRTMAPAERAPGWQPQRVG